MIFIVLPEVIEFLDQRRSSSVSSSVPINLTIKTSNSTEDVRNIDSDHSTVFNYDNDFFYKDEVSSDGEYGNSSPSKRAAEHGDVGLNFLIPSSCVRERVCVGLE